MFYQSVTEAHSRAIDPIDPSRSVFWAALLAAFDMHEVRYCALHAHGPLLYGFDFAVHSTDGARLGRVFSEVRKLGYRAVQSVQVASGWHRLVFARLDADAEMVALDLVFRSQAGTRGPSPDRLTVRRQRNGMLWVPHPEDALDFFLIEMILSPRVSPHGLRHFRSLIDSIGLQRAEARAQQLLGRDLGKPVMTACRSGFNPALSQELEQQLQRRVAQKSLHSVLAMLDRCWRKVTNGGVGEGAFLVFLGPDGVGKTTLLEEVSTALAPLFADQHFFRWRPAMFARAPRPSSPPHSKPLRSTKGSVSYLLFLWLDFAAGYFFRTRQALRKCGLVVFDRYYHDLLIDPKRYRYGGPLWLVNGLKHLVPPRGTYFLVLDADEHTIFARKQQLSIEEIRRQRSLYQQFSRTTPRSILVATDCPLERCKARTLTALLRHFADRTERRNPAWFGCPAELGTEGPVAVSTSGSELSN